MMNELVEGLRQLGLDEDGSKVDLLAKYAAELELWNRRLNLVSIVNIEQLVVRHILDSLAGLKVIGGLDGSRIADIGSGAGLPGMLLALFIEDRRFTLVERSGKKAGFLRSTAALLKIVDRVEVVETDLKKVRECFDIVTLRAFREFGDFYGDLRRITSDGGVIAAYKGRRDSIEADIAAAGLSAGETEIIPLDVPFLDEERHMLLIRPE